jgi:toxin CptA
MGIAPASLLFPAALLAAALMGVAIQRGATCFVAAVEEIITQRRAARLLALLEAAAWVAAGLVIIQAIGLLGALPDGHPATLWSGLGGALLGLGAWINRACLFGAIARFGGGEWAYLATPAGFLLGCLGFQAIIGLPPATPLAAGSVVLRAPTWVAWLCAALLAARIGLHVVHLAARRRAGAAAGVWTPHLATLVIALTFLLLLQLAGNWSYTDVLSEAARGMTDALPTRIALLIALLLGAMLGGRMNTRPPIAKPRPAAVARCLAGGFVMAWGGMLVPGQNDGLILLGMPLLWPNAWLGLIAMGAVIALARMAQARLSGLAATSASRSPSG